MTSCDKTSWTKSKSHSRTRAKPKSSKATRLSEIPKHTISSLLQTPSVTSWCTTRESSILPPFKPTLTDTKPPTKTRLHPSDLRVQVSPVRSPVWTLDSISLGKGDHSGPFRVRVCNTPGKKSLD